MSSREISEILTRLRDVETRVKNFQQLMYGFRRRLEQTEGYLSDGLDERMKHLEAAVELIEFALRKAGLLEG